MKARLFLPAVCLALLLQEGRAAAPAAPDKIPSDAEAAAVVPNSPAASLKQSTPADVVLKIMGKPDEIKPMKVPTGKAEIWVYRREIKSRDERVPIGSTPIMITVFNNDPAHTSRQINVGENIQYGDVHIITEETVELLIFNDRYVTQKVSRREFKRYN